jgi:hypothetical protein
VSVKTPSIGRLPIIDVCVLFGMFTSLTSIRYDFSSGSRHVCGVIHGGACMQVAQTANNVHGHGSSNSSQYQKTNAFVQHPYSAAYDHLGSTDYS